MSALRNWLTCLVKGHRYDITNLDVMRLIYCECCNRELFKRKACDPGYSFSTELLKSLVTPSDIPLAGGEGQAKEGQEGEKAIAIDAAAAANVIEAINCGRLAATKGHAIARPSKSLDEQRLPQYTFPSGDANFLKPGNSDRRYFAVSFCKDRP